MSTLSIVVLAKSKEEILPKTLASLDFGDELLITEKGVVSDFSAARNLALTKAKGEWTLFVDDDEVVPVELAAEIKQALEQKKYVGYLLHRQDFFAGKRLRFGETASVHLLRLAKKNAGRWQGKVHETWQITGPVGELKNPLLHYPHPAISAFISEINHYTDIRAREVKKWHLWETLAFPLAKFLQNYFCRLGFLDGRPGFVIAFMMSLHSLIARVKMYDLSQTS